MASCDIIFFQSKFIAAYAQSNEGDITPNLMPQHCVDHPEVPCDANTSKCLVNGKVRDIFHTLTDYSANWLHVSTPCTTVYLDPVHVSLLLLLLVWSCLDKRLPLVWSDLVIIITV